MCSVILVNRRTLFTYSKSCWRNKKSFTNMELCGFLIIMLSLTTVTRAEIEFETVSAKLYYSIDTSDSETNIDIFNINSTPFMFYDYGALKFVINGEVTDGIEELGQEQVTYFKERARGFQARLRSITKELIKLTNAKSIPRKKPSIHIYTEGNYTRQSKTLYCYAEKFYPFEIDINFLINGRQFTGLVQSSQLVFEADWTFTILKYIKIEPQNGDTYSCQAAHISLDQPLTVLLDQPSLMPYSGTIVCAVGVVAAVIGIVITLYMITKIYNRRGNLCTGQFCKQ
ncbi:RLA class II histocompatibility antigen, DP alpha-1 chain-like [Heptranchias perlo]|uniref:RLA class II histocompatibility antigen, DP alpha-1 chain-like n=1 Tax=Heptranchias perlo TaxID=212740 RepID=UPI00355A282F